MNATTTPVFDLTNVNKEGTAELMKHLGYKADWARIALPEMRYILCAKHTDGELFSAMAAIDPESEQSDFILMEGDSGLDVDSMEAEIAKVREIRLNKGKPAGSLDKMIDAIAATLRGATDSTTEEAAATEIEEAIAETSTATQAAAAVPVVKRNPHNPPPVQQALPAALGDVGASIAEVINNALGASLGITPEAVRQMVLNEMANFAGPIKTELAAVLADSKNAVEAMTAISQRLTDGMATEMAKRIAEIEQKACKTITVKMEKDGGSTATNLGKQHRLFEKLLRICAARDHSGNRLNVWIYGPAGTGKTTAAEKVAEALGLNFAFNGAIDSEYKLLGFTDAQGRIVSRPFREIFENGGVYLFDEADGSMPSALLAFNAALANGICDFPDGPIRRHKDCILLAGANTVGMGATVQFKARNGMDGATLDRFVRLHWPIDEDLERSLAGDTAWVKTVQHYREKAKQRGLIQLAITPRATIKGCALLEQGFSRDEVLEMTILEGLTDEQRKQLTAA